MKISSDVNRDTYYEKGRRQFDFDYARRYIDVSFDDLRYAIMHREDENEGWDFNSHLLFTDADSGEFIVDVKGIIDKKEFAQSKLHSKYVFVANIIGGKDDLEPMDIGEYWVGLRKCVARNNP